jgi:hypothetical protein
VPTFAPTFHAAPPVQEHFQVVAEIRVHLNTLSFFMNYLILLVSVGAAALLFWFCKTPDGQKKNDIPRALHWGTGGGFTGVESMYALTPDRQLRTRTSIKDTLRNVDRIGKRKVKKIFALADSLQLLQLDFNHPGNTYKYLEVQEGDQLRRIVWGDARYPVPAQIQNLFDQLSELSKK